MCSIQSNAFEASKNTACTDEPWVTNMKEFASINMYIDQYYG